MTVNVSYQRGYGGITLTVQQQTQLRALRDSQNELYKGNESGLGLGTPMYELLLSFISDTQVIIRHDEFGVPYETEVNGAGSFNPRRATLLPVGMAPSGIGR